MGKANSTKECFDNVRRETKIQKRTKINSRIKNTVTDKKSVFDGLTSRLNMAEKRDTLNLRLSQ